MECTQREPLAQWRNKVNLFYISLQQQKNKKTLSWLSPGQTAELETWYSNGTFDSLFVRVTITMSNLYTHTSTHESDTIRCVQHTRPLNPTYTTHIDPGCVCVLFASFQLIITTTKRLGVAWYILYELRQESKVFSFFSLYDGNNTRKRKKTKRAPISCIWRTSGMGAGEESSSHQKRGLMASLGQ